MPLQPKIKLIIYVLIITWNNQSVSLTDTCYKEETKFASDYLNWPLRSIFSDCLSHKKKHCFQCHYEKMCDGRQSNNCDTMSIIEYERLVASETKHLETKCATAINAAIDAAINAIENKRSELLEKIKSDPRQSAIQRINLDLDIRSKNQDIRSRIKISDPGSTSMYLLKDIKTRAS